MATLKLSFLGPPHIELDGVSLEIQRRRGMALLAYLAVTGEPQPRERLAALFWPENNHSRARAALRRDLSELNLALAGQWLQINRERVAMRAGYWVDVAQFQQRLAECARSPAACRAALSEAADLYRGDFLAGFTLADAPEFDEWQFFQTERLRQAFAAGLAQLVEILSQREEHESAIAYARRWLSLDPLHEPAHRQLMQLYAQIGQQAAALRQYETCRQLLADGLDVPPAPETTALFEQIRGRRLGPAAAKTQHPTVVAAPHHHLPTQTTAFVGRQEELADLRRLLLEEAECRLLALVGPGGIGKTRLALAVAAQVVHAFGDGVVFVPLVAVGEAASLIPAVAEALRLNLHGTTDPKDQLLDYLRPRQMLLVLDNFEHLLDGATLLPEILSRAPHVVLLVTTRERLNLREEWSYVVPGLAFPAAGIQPVEVLNTYSAVQLFLQRARQAALGFAPSPEEMADITQICRLVEGMPLGVELAAPWVRSLSCREIAAEIAASLSFLTAPLRNFAERHRSLHVVFGQTWARLSPQEQRVMQGLSVFRGGCTRAAAEQVAGAPLGVLAGLVDKALLRRTDTGRYELHELIRQFSEEQLQTDPDAAHQAKQRHRDYFVAFLEARTTGVKERRQKATLVEIKADMDNVRLAWRRAVADRAAQAMARAAECLFVYYLYDNGYDEGQTEFGRAVRAFAGSAAAPADDGRPDAPLGSGQPETLVGFLLAAQGYFLAHRHDLQAGERLLEQALVRLRRAQPHDPRKTAFALLWLGWAVYFQGRFVEGERCARESLALLRAAGDRWGEGWALLLSGNCLRDGRPAEAAEFYQPGLTLCRESGDQTILSYISFNLGTALRELGRYAQAQHHIDQGLRLAEELGTILGLGYAHFKRGQLEIALGKYAQAIQTLEQSTTFFREVGTVHFNSARLFLGLAFHLQGEHYRAEQLYAQSLTEFTAVDNKPWLARCLTYRGRLAYDRDELHEAEQILLAALTQWQAVVGQEVGMAVTLCYLGQVLVASGKHRHAEARDALRHALDLAIKHQLAPLALDVCVDVARLLAQVGETNRAIALLALAEQHEAATFETRERARRHLMEQEDHLSFEGAQTVQARGQAQELWTVTQTLRAELAEDERSHR